MGKQHLSRTPCLRHNLLIIKFKSYKSGHKLSMSKIPGYNLQLSLCCSNSKIGIFHFFGGVKCASGDTVRQVMEDGSPVTYTEGGESWQNATIWTAPSHEQLRVWFVVIDLGKDSWFV